MPAPTDTTPDTLGTNLKRSRLGDACKAHALLSKVKEDEVGRGRVRASIMGMINRNPPYNPADLQARGQGMRTNVDFGEGEAVIEARCSAYYNLILETPSFVQVTIDPSQVPEDQQEQAVRWGNIIEQEMDTTLKGWDGFVYNLLQHQREMVSFGIGPIYFPAEVGWYFSSAPMGNLLVPAGAKARIEECDFLALTTRFRADELYRYLETPEKEAAARERGWDTALLRKIIQDAATTMATHTGLRSTSWEALQEAFKDNALFVGSALRPIEVYFLYWREFDTEKPISFAILLANDAKEERYLFRQNNLFESYRQCIHPIMLGVGDGTYHAIRGLGHKIYDHCKAANDFLCKMADAGKLSASILLTPSGSGLGTLRARPKYETHGPFVVLPEGYQPAQSNFAPNLQMLGGVRQALLSNLNSNAGLLRPVADSNAEGQANQARRTAREAASQLMQETRLESRDILFYYSQLDWLLREVARRMLQTEAQGFLPQDDGFESARDFRRRCIRRGVPAAWLSADRLHISARRAIGYGSPGMRDLLSQEILSLSPMLPESGRESALLERLTALAGPANALRLTRDLGRKHAIVIDSSIAVLENSALRNGSPALAAPGQNHLAHLEQHFKVASEIVDEAGNDPITDAIVLRAVLNHIADTLSIMQGNPQYADDVEAYVAAFKSYQAVAEQVEDAAQAALQAQQEQAAEQQMLSEDGQLKAAKMAGDLQLKQQKEASMDQIRRSKARTSEELARNRARLQEELARARSNPR